MLDESSAVNRKYIKSFSVNMSSGGTASIIVKYSKSRETVEIRKVRYQRGGIYGKIGLAVFLDEILNKFDW